MNASSRAATAAMVILASVVAFGAEPGASDRAAIVQRAKAASAFLYVNVGTNREMASAFCIESSGIFVTCKHVVDAAHAKDNYKLVLNSGEAHERIVTAHVLRVSNDCDLAILKVDQPGHYDTLTLGDSDALVETDDLIAFGFPFGAGLAATAGSNPGITVSRGHVTSLRKLHGELEELQLDASLNPGNSGGPILDSNGTVVGAVSSGIQGAALNFAIPSKKLRSLLDKPAISISPDTIRFDRRSDPTAFVIHVDSLLPDPRQFQVTLTLGKANAARSFAAARGADGTYGVSAVPVPASDVPQRLKFTAELKSGSVAGEIGDRDIHVGKRLMHLRDLQLIQPSASKVTIAASGKTVRGAISGLENIDVDFGGQHVPFDLSQATKIELRSAGAALDDCPYDVSVRVGDQVVADLAGLIVFTGRPRNGENPIAAQPPDRLSPIAPSPLPPNPIPVGSTPGMEPTVIELGGQVDQVRTGGCGRILVFHVKDAGELIAVDVLAGKIVKRIPAEGDICYCMDRDKLILVLNNQQVMQRWDMATWTSEKTVMLGSDKPVKRAIMGSCSAGPLLIWTEGECRLFNLATLAPLIVNGSVQTNTGFGPWVSADGLTICDWGWSSGPYSLMRLSNLTTTSVDSRFFNVDTEDYNESWAMPSADGTQLIRHGATVYDASTDDLVALAPGPLKNATVLPTEDPRFLTAVRGEDGNNKTSSVAILSAFDRRVLYTLRKTVPVTGGMIATRSGRICSEPRVHYLPAEKKLVLIPDSDDRVVIYSLDLAAALKATGADYLYVISKPHTVLTAGQQLDYQIETLSSAGRVKYKLEEGPEGLTVSTEGRVTWTAAASAETKKVPVVITLSDASGEVVTHAIELHLVPKPRPTPDAPAPRDSTAGAEKRPNPRAGTPSNPPAAPSAKKTPDDPELKALAEKLCKKLQENLTADSGGNDEYTSTFTVDVGRAQRTAPGTGQLVLGVHEDRVFLIGGDFINYISHIDIVLSKVGEIWTCTTAKSTLDMAYTSHGPVDLPFPPKTHDLTRSIRALLDDVQNEPAGPGKKSPEPPPAAPAQKA